MWFIMIFLLFAILSTAFFGRTSVLRMHSLYIIGIGSIIIFILLLNLRRADVYNLAPILGNGAYNVFVKGLSDLAFYSGIIVIFFIPTNKISYSYRYALGDRRRYNKRAFYIDILARFLLRVCKND